MSRWPDGRRAAVSLTFDNLGEAAEIQLGLRGEDEPRGGHWSVVSALPAALAELAAAGLRATFFVEGINAETYPAALAEIAAAGHELGLHAWCHEEWGALAADPAAEAANLDRGLAALRGIGLDVRAFRPPGGLIGPGTAALLAARDVRCCSPAGRGVGVVDGVVVLPFAWPAVDVLHVLPQFGGLRARLTGSEEAGGPDAARDALLAAVDDVVAAGGHAALVLHTWMVEAEREQLRELLARCAAGAAAGELWVARCDEVAAWVAACPDERAAGTVLDETSWAAPR